MKKKERPNWYSVRCLFRWSQAKEIAKRNLYEERITVWRAESFDEAVELAECEARDYAKSSDVEYVEFAQAFHVFPLRLSSGAEVFSLLRESNYPLSEYLDRFFDTGDERQRDMPCEQPDASR